MTWVEISYAARGLQTNTEILDGIILRKECGNEHHLLDGWAIPDMSEGKKFAIISCPSIPQLYIKI